MARNLAAWDCPYCETKGIWGNVFECPGCDHPRPRGIHFYQVANAPIVTPEIAAQVGSGGPNWYCEHCDSGNKDNAVVCWKCGAQKGSSPSHEVRDYRQEERVPQNAKEAEQADPDGKSWVVPVETPADEAAQSDMRSAYVGQLRESAESAVELLKDASENLGDFIPILGAIITVVVAIILLVVVHQIFFKTHLETVSVVGFTWTQNVRVQVYQVVHETSWTTHPPSAYNIVSEYRDTGRDEKIHDGWETVPYQDTCYETVPFPDTCTRPVYESKTCQGTRDNGDGTITTYDYDCGTYVQEEYPCTNTRQEPYSCTKTRQEEVYHYEDIYDTYYQYDIDKWVTIANHGTSGSDHEPYYESVTLSNPYSGSGTPVLGQQQQLQEQGVYSVSFYSENPKIGQEGYFTREYPLDKWMLFGFDWEYQIEVNFVNMILSDPEP